MSSDNIRLGFIGAGAICRDRHLPGLKKIDGIELVACCNRSEASSRAIADTWNFREVTADWRELVARDDIDAVFIGTWPYTHLEMSAAALEAGKHVFCQARMCMNWEEAIAMCKVAASHPKQVNMICPPPHRIPYERVVLRSLREGALGELRDVSVVSLNASNLDTSTFHWREDVELSGVQILQAGIFAETLNAWVGDYESLSATISIPIENKKGRDGQDHSVEIPQIVQVHGRLEGGAVVTEHHSGLALHAARNEVTLFGSEGTIHVDIDSESIFYGKAGAALEPMKLSPEDVDSWRGEEDFIDAVRAARRGESWSVTPDFPEGARYMRKMQAIHQSAKTGKVVRLDDDYPLPA